LKIFDVGPDTVEVIYWREDCCTVVM